MERGIALPGALSFTMSKRAPPVYPKDSSPRSNAD